MRTEQEIFDELATVCTTPGYAHVVAFLCFRDNIVSYKDELKGEDYSKLFSKDRLIRTEISTLIGLTVRAPVDLSLPSPHQFQTLIQQSDALLSELHEAMNQPGMEIFQSMIADPTKNPFEAAEAMREPIFYGAESAYSFQYRDIALQKYALDDDWLRENKGFSSDEGRQIAVSIMNFSSKKLHATVRGLKDLPKDAWTVLPGFEFSHADIVAESG
ncbi:MAG: prepilin peptidase, partial [Gammaproteobacteria bacterium]